MVKNALRHKFDSDCSFDEFLVASRMAELEHKGPQTPAKKSHIQMQDTNSEASPSTDLNVSKKLDTVLAQLSGLNSRISKLEKTGHNQPPKPRTGSEDTNSSGSDSKEFIPTCHHCGKKGHIRPNCWSLNSKGSMQGDEGRSK